MSHNNSDQMKQCLNQTNNSPDDQPSRGGSVTQPPPADPAAPDQTTAKPSGTMGNKASASAESPGGGASGVSPERERASGASESEPMDTTDPLSSRTRATFPIDKLKTLTHFSPEFNKPLLEKGHTLLVDINWLKNGDIVPYQGEHVWDNSHVKLPHMYPNQSKQKSRAGPSRWEVTRQALERLITGRFSVGDVQSAILSYNSNNKSKWSFEVLFNYGKNLHHFDNNLHLLIPKMAKLALDLPFIIQHSIPLLRQHQSRAVTLSQQQISCLLANAFFCTFPHRNDTSPGSEYASYPSINFSSLFACQNDPEKLKLKTEKLRAIFHYFDTVTKPDQHPESKADGLVTFERICVPPSQLPDWNKQKKALTNLHVSAEGSIQREGTGMLQVDFASRFVGGGVLSTGLVQEEILFLMSPELIVARLFTEKLSDNECLRITGPQMYNLTEGYSKSFCWAGPFTDLTKRDAWKRRYRQIVAIDALDFKNPKDQYTKESITRELNKAFVGFSGLPKTAIATGNWGCGAFKGDPQLKGLIQLMAAAVANRDVAFFTFHNKHLASDIQKMHDILTKNRVTVDKLYSLLKEYCGHHARQHPPKELYRFIREKIGHNNSSL